MLVRVECSFSTRLSAICIHSMVQFVRNSRSPLAKLSLHIFRGVHRRWQKSRAHAHSLQMLMSSSAENRKKVNSQIAGVRRLHSAFAIACIYLCLLRGHYATGVGGWLGALHTFYLRPFEQGQYSLMWKFAPISFSPVFFSRNFTTSRIDFQLRLRSTLNKSNYYSTGTREVLKCMCWTRKNMV